jgi:MFS family permease
MPSKKKNVFWMGIVSMLTDISSEMILPILPIFMNTVLAANRAVIGLVEGIAESTASILKLFSGWLSDRVKKRKMLVVLGYGLSAVTKPLLALATAWQHVLAVRFSDRVGKGIRTSPRDALIAESSSKKQRGRAFGLHRFLDNLGAVIGSLIAAYLLFIMPDSYRTIFWLSAIPAALSIIVALIFIKDIEAKQKAEKKVSFSLKRFDKNFRKFIFVVTLFSLANFSYAFFILRAQSLKIAITLIPIIYVVYNLSATIFSIPAGRFADTIGHRRTLFGGYLFFGLTALGFAFAYSSWQVWVLFAMYGVGIAIIETASRAIASDIIKDKSLRGTAIGTYHAFVGMALLPANIIFGFIATRFGEAVAFGYAGAIAVIAAILLLGVNDRR